MAASTGNLKTNAAQTEPNTADPKGVRIDGYFGPGLLRPGVGKLVQRSGEPQFCGSMALRVFQVEEGPHKIDPNKMSRRFSGEFMGVTFEGKRIYAAEGYLPSSIERSFKGIVERGGVGSFAGDLWCEPAENTPLGYAFRVYDRRPRGEADPLMALAVEAGVIERPALPAPPTATHLSAGEIDPETGEVVEREEREAAE